MFALMLNKKSFFAFCLGVSPSLLSFLEGMGGWVVQHWKEDRPSPLDHCTDQPLGNLTQVVHCFGRLPSGMAVPFTDVIPCIDTCVLEHK